MSSYFSTTNLSLVSLLVSSFAVYAIPISESLFERSLSCNGNVSDGTTYTTASSSYQIHCGTDYYGGDLPSTTTATFEDCLSACDSATGCLAVAYVSGSCYLKSKVNAPTANDGVWGAKRTDAPAQTLSCANNQSNGTTYQSGQQSYTILCGVDNYGGDISSITTSTLELCIAACDSTNGCIDVSYSGNTCYMKNKLTTWTKNGNVDTAILTSAEQGASNPSPPGGPSCDESDGQQYTASSGAIFDIICGVDYYGGDLISLDAAAFETCIEACAANAQCVDVSYLGTSCYLKSVLKSPISYSSVWTAKLHSANLASSSTTSLQTTTSSTATITTPSSATTTTTRSATTTTTTTTPSTPTTITTTNSITTTTSQGPLATNLVSNGEFDNGGSPWSWAANGNQGALSGRFFTDTQAYSGSSHARLDEGTYGDTGTRSMCVSQYVYIPSTGVYSLNFYIGRISFPPPGSSVSTDSIGYSVIFDGVDVSGGNVCGASGNTCPLKALDGANRYASVTLNLNGNVGYRQLSICGTYTTPRRGTEDAMLVDKVSLYGPN